VAAEDPHAASRPLVGMRVLLVDDLIDTLQSFAMLLELDGATVATAANGRQALELAAAQDFDLLLCDIGMPDMDGHALIATLRKGGRNATLPAIALTGFSRQSDAERALAAGFDGHLGKPFSLDEVTRLACGLVRNTPR